MHGPCRPLAVSASGTGGVNGRFGASNVVMLHHAIARNCSPHVGFLGSPENMINNNALGIFIKVDYCFMSRISTRHFDRRAAS
jgi:hypothetical protein